MEQVFADCVAERVRQGTTVLLSSHILSEVEQLADRVTIIREGRAVESGTLDELRHLHRSRIHATVERVPEALGDLAGVHDLTVDGQTLTCTVDPEALPEVLARLTAAGVTALTSAPPTLEELFLDAYRHEPAPTS
jgi:ABC-2 type transport system ATP-binding protein